MTARTLNIGYFTQQESVRLQQNGIDPAQKTYSLVDLLGAGVAFTNVIGPAMERGSTGNIKPIFDARIPYGETSDGLDLGHRRILFVEELEAVRNYQAGHADYTTHKSHQDISDRMEQILNDAVEMSGKNQELQMKVAVYVTRELMAEHEAQAVDYREFWLGSDEESRVQRNPGVTAFTLQEIFSDEIKVNRINGIPYKVVGSRVNALYQGSPFLDSNNDLSRNIDVTFYVNEQRKRLNMAVVELARNGLSQMNGGLVCDDPDQVYLTMKEFEELFMSQPTKDEQDLLPDLPVTRDELDLVKSRLKYRVEAWANK